MTSFTITRLPGASLRLKVTDLTDINGEPVTSGASVAINLYDQNNALVITGTVEQENAPDDATYYADITLPQVTRPTKYVARATGSRDDETYKDIGIIWVVPA